MNADEALHAWAESGAMALTGRSGGPPLAVPGTAALHVAQWIEGLRTRFPHGRFPGMGVVSERAALVGLGRQGPYSCGRYFRTVECEDGLLGLSLPRAEDLELVPALVRSESVVDPWESIQTWASSISTSDACARSVELGLAAAVVDSLVEPLRPGVVVHRSGGPQPVPSRVRVLDLSALWAGPLCSDLLFRCGLDVVKVESWSRPDGARRGNAAFFDLLHHGHRSVALNLPEPAAVDQLRGLIAEADVVIESSRARVLAQWGISAEDAVAAGTTWVSITAYGRSSHRIGFGDDVAVGAGLGARERNFVHPPGDALADPVTGVRAALATIEALEAGNPALIDVSMHHVSAEVCRGVVPPHSVFFERGSWHVESASGRSPVLPPRLRRPDGQARSLGADTPELVS